MAACSSGTATRICKGKKKGLLQGYSQTLVNTESKDRYSAKISHSNCLDPYEIPKNDWSDDVDLWPSVTYIHVGMYLLFSASAYTQEHLLNYKSLGCYQTFVNGWVREVLVKRFGDKRLVIAKVNHSQRLSEKPLVPWIICESNGKVVAAHCNCMAGLGESCSHIAALLWAIEAGVKQRNSLTVTQKKAYWVLPSVVKSIPYAKVEDIQFYKNKDNQKASYPPKNVPPPSSSEMSHFFPSLSKCPSKPAILSLVNPFSDNYVPKSLDADLPTPLSTFYQPRLADKNFSEILDHCERELVRLSITDQQKHAVEEKTRQQANSKIWFQMRTGRVTASKLKSACHTDPVHPSASLIMSICHPELAKFSTTATRWGCSHEKVARSAYETSRKMHHEDFKVTDSGLHIHCEHGFLGASPDGLVNCKCCGPGVCEIKCPYCKRNDDLTDAGKTKDFCLETTSDGEKILKRNHQYYYQVQAQMYCTGYPYCDFVVWTEKSLFIERIFLDEEFMKTNVKKVREFVLRGILPELLARWFSRPTPETPAQEVDKFCYCGEGESGDMIACDNETCRYQWFHFACLKLTAVPATKRWYCPYCQKEKRKKIKKN